MIGWEGTGTPDPESEGGGSKARDGFLLAGAVAATVSFLPFLRMLVQHQAFYFRDLSGYFLPVRKFLLDGLSHGEMRFWNPFTHEGTPLLLSPFGYLPDLLQLLDPTEFGISLSLAFHIPMAAVSFTLLAREFRLGPVAAVAGALIYSLGGFSLSSINLYVYAQAIAWAPLFILTFRRAVERGGARAVSWAALALAVTVSTTGVEIALQACLLAVVVAPPSSWSRLLRAAATITLAVCLAAATILPMLKLAGDSERGAGLATSVVLAHSIHPLALVQVLIAGFFGDTSNLTGSWWGVNFFTLRFPYILSLYLGPAAVALACAGVATNQPMRRRLSLLAVGGVVVGLGRYVGWDSFFDLSPALRFLRYPVKAFFTVHFCVALLASFAVNAIATGESRLLRLLTLISMTLGGAMVGVLLIPRLAPGVTTWFLADFLDPRMPSTQRDLVMRFITSDAATAGLVAIAVGIACWLALRRRFALSRTAVVVTSLLGADLIRAGAGLNPTVTTDFYVLSPEMSREVESIRQSEGRVFTCDPQSSSSYWQGRRVRGADHDAFTMALLQETLTPDFNVPYRIRTALSIDRTMLVPTRRVLSPEMATCADFHKIVPSLRAAGVTRVLSAEPLSDPSLRFLKAVAPARIAPVKVHIYELDRAAPRFSQPVEIVLDIPNHLSVVAVTARPTPLVVQEPFAGGWRATVNGVDTPILRTSDGHRSIPLPGGRSGLRMSYETEGLRIGVGISIVASLICFGLLWPIRRGDGPADPSAFQPRERNG